MFFINRNIQLKIVLVPVEPIEYNSSEISYIENFYSSPELFSDYIVDTENTRIDDRVIPVNRFLEDLTGFSAINKDLVYLKNSNDEFFEIRSSSRNAIISLDDNENTKLQFYRIVDLEKGVEVPEEYNIPTDQLTEDIIKKNEIPYKIGDLAYEFDIMYNTMVIYNPNHFHLKNNLEKFQILHLI